MSLYVNICLYFPAMAVAPEGVSVSVSACLAYILILDQGIQVSLQYESYQIILSMRIMKLLLMNVE